VWVDPVSFDSVKRREAEEPLVVCVSCLSAVLPANSVLHVTDEQAEALPPEAREQLRKLGVLP